MTKRRLNQYADLLDAAQISEGMNAALRNAARLLKDAELLLENGRYPSAASLAALSIEEAGKLSILRRLALARTATEAKKAWRAYRTHTSKNAHWLLPQLVAQGARTLEDLAALFNETSEHPYLLDQVKQLGLYSDCLGNAHWSLPDEVISRSLAEELVGIARVFSRDRACTPQEVAVWVKHMQPVTDNHGWHRTALLNYQAELVSLGLADTVADMESFVFPDTPQIKPGGADGG